MARGLETSSTRLLLGESGATVSVMFTQIDSLSTDTDAVDSDGPYHLKLSSVIGRLKAPTIRLCLASIRVETIELRLKLQTTL